MPCPSLSFVIFLAPKSVRLMLIQVFRLSFVSCMGFPSFYFNLPTSYLKWVSAYSWVFFEEKKNASDSLCLLIDMFRPFTFTVIIDRFGFSFSILLFILCFFIFLFLSFLFPDFSLSFSLLLDCFSVFNLSGFFAILFGLFSGCSMDYDIYTLPSLLLELISFHVERRNLVSTYLENHTRQCCDFFSFDHQPFKVFKRRRIVGYTYPHIYHFFCIPLIPDILDFQTSVSFFYTGRTSFSISFRVYLLATNYFSFFFSSENVIFIPKEYFLLDIECKLAVFLHLPSAL